MSGDITRIYNKLFQRFTAEFFDALDVDWYWFKAQAVAESLLNPLALSTCGAIGLMQIMPRTALEIADELGVANDYRNLTRAQRADITAENINDTIYQPELNVRMGIYYDRKMFNIFAREDGLERIRFMLAAYNCGAGNLIKAQAMSANPRRWDSVSQNLFKITGMENAQQTIDYVKKIERLHGSI